MFGIGYQRMRCVQTRTRRWLRQTWCKFMYKITGYRYSCVLHSDPVRSYLWRRSCHRRVCQTRCSLAYSSFRTALAGVWSVAYLVSPVARSRRLLRSLRPGVAYMQEAGAGGLGGHILPDVLGAMMPSPLTVRHSGRPTTGKDSLLITLYRDHLRSARRNKSIL
jgi:hypothetical protein